MDSRVGKLLIAHPNLPGDNWFHRTVIYIYNESPQQGTLGVTLNVPTNIPFKKLCYDKGVIYPSEYPVVHKGGPVSEASIVILHTDDWNSRNTIPAGQRYRLSSDTEMFSKLSLGDCPVYWRPYVGLTAWEPGQLDAEMRGQFPYTQAHSWLTCDATDELLFGVHGHDQWKAAVEFASTQMIDSWI